MKGNRFKNSSLTGCGITIGNADNAAAWYLVQINALYANQRELASGHSDRVAYRNEHSRPLMEAMKARLPRDQQMLEEQGHSTKTLEAIRYALGQWDALMRYLEHT